MEFEELQYFTGVTGIGREEFRNCKALRSTKLDNVKTIGFYAFAACSNLKSVGSLFNVEKIEKNTFDGCTNLNIEVSMPSLTGELPADLFANSGITKVLNLGKITSLHGNSPYDRGPFGWCYSLTQVTFPPTLTNIGAWSFQRCKALEWIKILSAIPPTLGDNAFYDTNNDFIIYVPTTSVDTYKSASGWSTYASRIQAMID